MPQTGSFSSTDIYRRVASKTWYPGSTVSWSPAPAATQTIVGEYNALRITAACTLTITGGSGVEFEYIVVAGGGPGGNRGLSMPTTQWGSGGGGAGGVSSGRQVLEPGSYPVQIGGGGSSSTRTQGTPSFIGSNIVAVGGGVGGGVTAPSSFSPTYADSTQFGQPGGSGGGYAYSFPISAFGSSSAAGQGNPGGLTWNPNGSGTGGGGALRAGFNGSVTPSIPAPAQPGLTGGQGGAGILVEFTGTPTFVAGGGGGGTYSGTLPTNPGVYPVGGPGGEGGGGNAGNISWNTTGTVNAQAGTANTGGGGGAAGWDSNPTYNGTPTNSPRWNDAGNGGSGVIFLRWRKV